MRRYSLVSLVGFLVTLPCAASAQFTIVEELVKKVDAIGLFLGVEKGPSFNIPPGTYSRTTVKNPMGIEFTVGVGGFNLPRKVRKDTTSSNSASAMKPDSMTLSEISVARRDSSLKYTRKPPAPPAEKEYDFELDLGVAYVETAFVGMAGGIEVRGAMRDLPMVTIYGATRDVRELYASLMKRIRKERPKAEQPEKPTDNADTLEYDKSWLTAHLYGGLRGGRMTLVGLRAYDSDFAKSRFTGDAEAFHAGIVSGALFMVAEGFSVFVEHEWGVRRFTSVRWDSSVPDKKELPDALPREISFDSNVFLIGVEYRLPK
jgi:hypothetical protein